MARNKCPRQSWDKEGNRLGKEHEVDGQAGKKNEESTER